MAQLLHWDCFISFFRLEERVPPTGPPTPLPEASGLPSWDQPGSTLLSFRGMPALGVSALLAVLGLRLGFCIRAL